MSDKRYICIKAFCVDHYDDGFLIENDSVVIEKGSVYKLDESDRTMIGGKIHLDSINDNSWIEITKQDLSECFEEV